LEQMIRTTPFRRITLHFSHRVRIDGLTFISRSALLASLAPT
jgi:hypothetical protein